MTVSEQRSAINEILASWNPIGVPAYIAHDEYTDYIDPIISKVPNRDLLVEFLEHTVYETMGLNYEKSNPEHRSDLVAVADRILMTIGENRDS